MKKLILALLILTLTLSAVPALAITAQYPTTQRFMDYMDANGTKYTYVGVNSNTQNEHVDVVFNGDNRSSIKVECFFNKDLNRCVVYVWNVIDYDAGSKSLVVMALDGLNSKYYFTKFYTDDDDNSVTAEGYIRLDDSADYSSIISRLVNMMAQVVDEAYPTLKIYAK